MTKTRSNIVFLEGKKVFLRPLLRRDIREEYLSWLNNPNLTQYSCRFRTWPTNEKRHYQARDYRDCLVACPPSI